MDELAVSDIAIELLAPGVAIGVLIAAVKTALPTIQARFYPMMAITLGICYAAAASITSELVVGDGPVAVVLLGISVGAQASGIQGWVRSQDVTSTLADRIPGTR